MILVSVSCGEGFTVLLGTDGRVRACGDGRVGHSVQCHCALWICHPLCRFFTHSVHPLLKYGALGRGDLVSSSHLREVRGIILSLSPPHSHALTHLRSHSPSPSSLRSLTTSHPHPPPQSHKSHHIPQVPPPSQHPAHDHKAHIYALRLFRLNHKSTRAYDRSPNNNVHVI